MKKDQLITLVNNLKIDLKYLKQNLQLRLDNNNINATSAKYQHQYAEQAGVSEAWIIMDNIIFERSIKFIEEIEQSLDI